MAEGKRAKSNVVRDLLSDIGVFASCLGSLYQCVNAPSENDERWGLEEDPDFVIIYVVPPSSSLPRSQFCLMPRLTPLTRTVFYGKSLKVAVRPDIVIKK